MKQLKFNPDKDMKELEKYGFRYVSSEYYDYYWKKVYLKNDMDDRVIYKITEFGDFEIVRLDGELDTTIYDLIKANLLIVESDEDE